MKSIACAEYNEVTQNLVIVFSNGESEFHYARTLKQAWDILRDENICADIKPTRRSYGQEDSKISS